MTSITWASPRYVQDQTTILGPQNRTQGSCDLQGESKKSVISKNMAITTLKSIRKGKNWCILENSAYMQQDRHQTFQNWWKNGLEKLT